MSTDTPRLGTGFEPRRAAPSRGRRGGDLATARRAFDAACGEGP